MADFKVFELDALEREQAGGPAYREFLRRPGAAVGLFLLPTDGTDQQHPHFTDEIYVVLGGKAGLRIEDTDQEVRAGSVVTIGHGVEHHFYDITEDLRVLAIFAPPEPGDREHSRAVTGRRHRVVVGGGGFGGVNAARVLAGADVTIVDRTNHHLFQPLLYQVATGIMPEGLIAPALRSVVKRQARQQAG